MLLPRRPRLKNFSYTGLYRYFLTFCTQDRRPLFADAAVVHLVFTQILRTCSEEGFSIIAHVFMPDHLHLLVRAERSDSDLQWFVSRTKQRAAWEHRQAGRGRLWQPSFYDHVLREDQSELPFIRYILENPVRAGLVERCEDYPHVGAGAISMTDMIRSLDDAGVVVWEPPRPIAP
jgi:putative transposase